MNRPRWVIGLAAIVGLILVSGLAMGGIVKKLFPKSGDEVTAVFGDVGSLVKGSPVRVHGIEAGKVDKVELDEGARSVTVTMTVYDDALPLHGDASAAIKYRTILGGNLAVEIDPGSSGELEANRIPLAATTNQVELDDVTTALDTDARRGMTDLIDETPRGLADSDAPQASLRELRRVSPPLAGATRAARGQRIGDLRELVRSAAVVVRAVDQPAEPLRDVVQDAAITVRATAERQADIRALLQRAPSALSSTRETARRLMGTLALADPLLDSLGESADDVAPTVRELRPVLEGADRLLGDAVPLLRSLRPAATDLMGTARQAVPLIRGLRPSVNRLAGKILPYLDKVDPDTRRATYQMIGPTFAGIVGASAQFDKEGHWFRFPALGGTNTINSAPCREFITDPERPGLVNCDSLFKALNGVLGTPGKRRETAGR